MSQEMKIAKIINTKQVVVNAGRNAGLKVGDKLEIIDKFGDSPIIDPDTGEDLGTLDLPKGFLSVTQVYSRMAIAESPRVPMLPTMNINSALFPAAQKDLNVDPEQITGGLPSPSGEKIKVGDIVIKR